VEVVCIPQPDLYLLGKVLYHVKVLQFVRSKIPSFDVILFHQMSAPWLLLLRLARRLAGSQHPLLVMDTRDLNPAHGNFKDRLRVQFDAFAQRAARRWADGQTTITSRMADLLQIPPEQLWGIWPSGVIVERFAQACLERRWPEPGEAIHLMYIGVLLAERNLQSLGEAVVRANAEGMDFVLTLVGDGAHRLALENFASQTQGQVHVLQPVPHDRVPRLLAQAHVGVTSLPSPDDSKYQASSPVKLFEYMAAGLPVLATRNVCHTEVVGAGSYAFWAEDASVEGLLTALRLVWHDRAALASLGSQAKEAAEAWTWASAARKLCTALKQGIAEYRSQGSLLSYPVD
jgi:glycosyltransferase involved in cell wall biosynthesis